MSYMNDDGALCDMCNSMWPAGWPNWHTPWPVSGPVLVDGRITADHRDNFNLCTPCLQSLVLAAPLLRDERELALASKARWEASQRLLDQAEAVVRGSTA
jgi:hypothetical protein